MDRANSGDASLKTPYRSTGRSRGNGIWNHAFIAIGIATLGLVCAGLLLWWQLIASAGERATQHQIELINRAFAGYFNGQIEEIKVRFNAVASAAETIDTLASNDPQKIAALGRQLTEQHGFARRIELIPKGQAETDNNGVAPISFAALNLIQRAETNPFVGPEISRTQEQLVFIAQPILQDGVVRGVLFGAFDKKGLLFDPLVHMDANVGRVKIMQSLDGTSPYEVFSFGEEGSGADTVRSRLTAENWEMTFSPNLDVLKSPTSIAELFTGLAVLAAFFLAATSFAFSSLSRKLDADAEQLSNYTMQLLRGRGAKLEPYRLPAFQQMASTFAKNNRARRSGAADGPADALEDGSVDDLLGGIDEKKPKRKQRPAKPSAAKSSAEKEDDLLDDDGGFLEVDASASADDNFGIEVSEDVGPIDMGLKLSAEIFRAYDIRGITTRTLTADVVYWIGRAFAAQAQSEQQTRVAVGRDGRHSSVELKDALVRGLTEGGADVLDIGEIPTPVLYFATHALDTGTGIMITGSHNPPEYNGLKMMIAGVTLAEDRIQELRRRIEENRLTDGSGEVETVDMSDHYVDRILEDVVVAQPCKVVVDCGNGVAGNLAPRLLKELGCEVVPLYCEVDGDFPNHHPDPADPANLEDLITVVKAEKADLGLAFDGDGDRLGVVTGSGEIIWPDKLLMLFARDIVGRNPGADIIYDVKCSRHLNNLISEYGGRPIMWRTGHSHMKAKLKETGALLAGEFSGHICFGERWFGFDDALYSAARLLEILGSEDKSADEIFSQFPITYSTPEIKIETTEKAKFEIIEKLTAIADFGDGTVTNIDGVRVDFADGWGLVRASNTSPVLTLRFEADGQSALERIRKVFQDQLSRIDPRLKIG